MIQSGGMSGHRGHLHSKPAREIFLTSLSLSFSSLSSSSTSWDDVIELNPKDSRTSCEDNSQQKGKLSDASSQGSEISGVTHVRTLQPGLSPPSSLRPVQLMNNGLEFYDPERIPPSVFGKTGGLNWSDISNDSLFSLKMDGCRMSNGQAFRRSNIKPEEVLMPGEYISYSPSLLVKLEDATEERSEMKEIKSRVTLAETDSDQEKSSSIIFFLWTANPSSSDHLDKAPSTKIQSSSPPAGDKKSKKRKKTKQSKKKKNKNICCVWSWLCSGISKCDGDLCCYKWRKCDCCYRGPKVVVL